MKDKQREILKENKFFEDGEVVRESKRKTFSTLSNAGITAAASAAINRSRREYLENMPDSNEALAFKKFTLDDGTVYYVGGMSIEVNATNVLKYLDRNARETARLASDLLKATSRNPGSVAIKRNLATPRVGNFILDFNDEIFTEKVQEALETRIDDLTSSGYTEDEAFAVAEAELDVALQDALTHERTPEMQDIIRTMLPRQYELAELPRKAVLTVQGGPGSGKTAVALKRLEVLMFDGLKPNEVAFVGPNNDFYHYVKSMLPKIPTKSGDGAEEVEFKNIHELSDLDLIASENVDSKSCIMLKSSPGMKNLVDNSIKGLIRWPVDPIKVGDFELSPMKVYEFLDLSLQIDGYSKGRLRLATLIVNSFVGGRNAAQPNSKEVESLVNMLWPKFHPVDFYRALLGNRGRLLEFAPENWTAGELRELYREYDKNVKTPLWSSVDIGILDYLSIQFGRGVKKFKYLIVDESQDLTSWQIRSVSSRSIDGSVMLIGDFAQASLNQSFQTWVDLAENFTTIDDSGANPHLHEELTLTFRLPNEIVDTLNSFAEEENFGVPPLHGIRSVKDSFNVDHLDFDKRSREFSHSDWHRDLRTRIDEMFRNTSQNLVGERSIAVIGADDMSWSVSGEQLKELNVQFMTPEMAKGREFDYVVVLNSCAIHSSAPFGAQSLYVALSRASQGLLVLADRHCQVCPLVEVA